MNPAARGLADDATGAECGEEASLALEGTHLDNPATDLAQRVCVRAGTAGQIPFDRPASGALVERRAVDARIENLHDIHSVLDLLQHILAQALPTGEGMGDVDEPILLTDGLGSLDGWSPTRDFLR